VFKSGVRSDGDVDTPALWFKCR